MFPHIISSVHRKHVLASLPPLPPSTGDDNEEYQDAENDYGCKKCWRFWSRNCWCRPEVFMSPLFKWNIDWETTNKNELGSLRLRPENRPSVFWLFCVVICWVGGGVGGCNNVLCLRCYVGDAFCTSVDTLHVTLDTPSVLRWRHFMLRWRRLLYFGGDTSCYVGDVYCTSVETLHVTLDTSTVLRWRHFMLRWRRLLYFGGDTSCYVGHVFCGRSVECSASVGKPLQRPIYEDGVSCPAR